MYVCICVRCMCVFLNNNLLKHIVTLLPILISNQINFLEKNKTRNKHLSFFQNTFGRLKYSLLFKSYRHFRYNRQNNKNKCL